MPTSARSGTMAGVEPSLVLSRQSSMRLVCSLVVAAVAISSGCGALPGSSAAAVWTVAPGERIDAGATEFTVLVNRLGCNSGVTGEVQEPDVRLGDDEVVLTFTVTPGEPSAATCQGNNRVRYDVTLPEPVGNRRLVDGQCGPEGEARGTTFCRPSGVRHQPAT